MSIPDLWHKSAMAHLNEALRLLADAPPVGTEETADWIQRRDEVLDRIEECCGRGDSQCLTAYLSQDKIGT